MDITRSSKDRTTKPDDKRFIKRVKRSPTHLTRPFNRRYFPSHFNHRPRDNYFYRRPSFGMRFQRYHRPPTRRLQPRSHSPRVLLRSKNVRPITQALSQHSEKRPEKSASSTTLEKTSITPDRSRSSSRGSERPVLSFTVAQEEEISSGRETLSSVTRAAARSRAIQRKREEIEEVYRQDCDTFGVVVKMLVAKDPSLERPIQTSLRENLREIGMRCVEAMKQFIHEYDSKEPGTPSQSQPQLY